MNPLTQESRTSKRSNRSSRPGSSNSSSCSGGRSSKSAKELYMQEAARMAALQAEYEYKSKLVVLESERKIASQQAKLNVYGQFLKSEEEDRNRIAVKTSIPTTTAINQVQSHQASSSSTQQRLQTS